MDAVLVPRKKARIVTAIFYLVSGLVTATWASRIPDIQHKLSLSDPQLGLVLFSLPVGLFIAMPLSAWLVAKYGAANLLALGAVLFAGLLCLLGFSAYTWQLSLSLLLYGLSRNFFNISLNTHSIEVQQLYEKPVIVTFHGVWSLACLAGAGLGTLMIANKIPVHWHFLLVASIGIITCIVLRNYKLFDRPSDTGKRPLFVKPDKYLFMLGLLAFCTILCEGITFDWSVNYFDRAVHVEKSRSTFGYTAFIIAMCIGRLVGDKLVEKAGTTRILVINGLLLSCGFLLVVVSPTLVGATAGFLLVGFGNATTVPVIYSLAGKSTTMPTSYAFVSVTMIGFLGFLAGPLIAGFVSGLFGMKWVFTFTAILALFVPALALLIKRVKE